jgi:hypothetical protein
MDRVREFLEHVKHNELAEGHFLGLLHVLIGRQVTRGDGAVVTTGLTWRELAAWLKKVRWKREAALELGFNLRKLPPRDRVRFWYTVITQARVDSAEAVLSGNRLAEKLLPAGYTIGPAPTGERKSG